MASDSEFEEGKKEAFIVFLFLLFFFVFFLVLCVRELDCGWTVIFLFILLYFYFLFLNIIGLFTNR